MRAQTQALSIALFLSILILVPRLASAASRDACSLVSSSDAQSALGEPVGPPRAENRSFGAGEGTSCKYRSTIGGALKAKTISLTVHYSQTDITGSADGIAQNLKSAGFKGVRRVAGIGTAALWGTNILFGKAQGELTVIQGKSVMLVVLIDGVPDEADALDRAKAIAAKAIGKL